MHVNKVHVHTKIKNVNNINDLCILFNGILVYPYNTPHFNVR